MASEHSPEELTPDAVRHVAKLAQLHLTESEVELFSEQLGAVLDYAGEIENLDMGNEPPLTQVFSTGNVLREDQPSPSLDRDTVLEQAPSAEEGRFRVGRILGEEP